MQEQIQQLKDSELTQVLADGFALLYHRKPKFPVTYLANYLKNYQKAKSEKKKINDKISHNKKLLQQMDKEKQQLKNLQKANEQKKLKHDEKAIQFLNEIQKTEYHDDILNFFCNWIEKRFNLTGVYIGELKNVKKKVNLADEDAEEAHFDAQAPKIIYFQNCSDSHKNLMIGKTLSQQSVLGKLLTGNAGGEAQNQQPTGQGQQGIVKEQKPKDQIYFPTVVDNKQLHFFKFPRLGSFFGIGSKINSYLSPKNFDENYQRAEVYRKQLQQYEKLRQERQNKFKQVYDEKQNSGAQEQQLQAMEKQFQKQQQQFPKPQQKQFDVVKRQLVFGFDTLGQDREISKEDQVKIKQYVNFLKKCWEERQLEQLNKDIDRHIKLQDKIEIPHQQTFLRIISDDDREAANHEEVQKFKQNPTLMELQLDTQRIQKLKQHLQDEKYQPFLEQILKAKVLKYQQILKYWLIFTGKKKQQINIQGTNLLNYRKSKQYLSKQEFTKHMHDYNLRGARPQALVPNYAKWERIQRNLQKLDAQNVAVYNIYLAFILKYLQIAAKVRKADRAKRVNIMIEQRKARALKRADNERKIKVRQQKLEAARAEAQQKQEQFDEAAWEHQYNEAEENALVEIPPQIHDQIDRDLEIGEMLFPEEDVPVQNLEVQQPAQ